MAPRTLIASGLITLEIPFNANANVCSAASTTCGPTPTPTATPTSTPPVAGPTYTPTPQVYCTPPPCSGGVYYCPGSCPGGCGTICVTPTPPPTPASGPSPTPKPPQQGPSPTPVPPLPVTPTPVPTVTPVPQPTAVPQPTKTPVPQVDPSITINPLVGQQFTVTGWGFTPNNTCTVWERPTSGNARTYGTFTGPSGAMTYSLSYGSGAPGIYEVWAVDYATGRASNHATYHVLR